MTCTCPYRATCWHGCVCGTQQKITDRPLCYRPLDGRDAEPVIVPAPKRPDSGTGGAVVEMAFAQGELF
jgi:hypothetical protein